MIPVGPIVWIVLRLANGGTQGSQRNPTTTSPMLLLPIFAAGLFLWVWGQRLHGLWAFIGALALLYFVLFLIGRWLITLTFVRLGMPRAAYHAGRILAVFCMRDDVAGGSCLLAVLAALKGAGMEVHGPWLDAKLQDARKRRAVWLVAAGILQGSRGNMEWAASALIAADTWPPKRCPSFVRHVALRWLTCDALSRGHYVRAASFAGRGSGGDRWLRAVHRVVSARMLPGHKEPSARELRRVADLAARLPSPLSAPEPPATLEDVLRAHYALMASGNPGAAEVERVALGWDRVAENPAIRAEITRRGLVLSVRRPAEAHIDALIESATADLSHVIREKKLPGWAFQRESATLGRALGTVRNDYLRELEHATQALRRRSDDGFPLHPTDEAVELGRLRLLHLDTWLLGGSDLRPMVFRSIHRDVCSYGVWLDGSHPQARDVAHIAFRWLLEEAYMNGDAEGIKLQKKNSAVTA